MAKGYLVAALEVTDPLAYEPYRRQVPALIERHGGRYLARGGRMGVLEGEAAFSRLVVVEFSSVTAAEGFYNDPDYQRIIDHRRHNARGTLVIVEGV